MIISKTPLRISIVGGGTDLPEWFEKEEGCVIGTSIDKFVYIILKERFDDKIAIGYTKSELVDKVDDIQHDLVRAAAKATGMTNGFEIKTLSDIPSEGSGLGSSSAYLVGLLNAFYQYQNRPKENMYLSLEAYYLERYILGRSVGMQDHLLCGLGGQRKIIFRENLPISDPIYLPKDNLFMHFTGVTRNANTILKDQVSRIEDNMDLYRQLAMIAKHFDSEKLEDSLGEGWSIKRKLSPNISNPEIDRMIDTAYSGGATALKVLGAGGGGFLLSYVPQWSVEQFKKAMSNYKELPFSFTNYGTRIVYNGY